MSENYLQHADHFLRIIDEKALNQKQNTQNSQTQVEKINSSEETKLFKHSFPEFDTLTHVSYRNDFVISK